MSIKTIGRHLAGALLLAAGSVWSLPAGAEATGLRSGAEATGLRSGAEATGLRSGAEAVPEFRKLVVFGDSLSDNGNAGRFSNGPVWVEQLAERLSVELEPARLGGGNFAVGGARLDPRSGPYNLRAQADTFLRQPPPGGRTLYVVYGGGNDLLAALGSSDPEGMTDRAVESLKGILSDLARHGAEDILVPNLPDIGITPAVRANGGRAVAAAAELTRRFNEGLERALQDLPPGLRIHRLDVRSMAEQLETDPSAYGFRNISAPCNERGNCDGYLFWDNVHPTSDAHGRLADAALRVLGAAPR